MDVETFARTYQRLSSTIDMINTDSAMKHRNLHGVHNLSLYHESESNLKRKWMEEDYRQRIRASAASSSSSTMMDKFMRFMAQEMNPYDAPPMAHVKLVDDEGDKDDSGDHSTPNWI